MIGVKLGSYEITAKLGEGGMGQVWKANDSHLRRDVAVKVLPERFTADPERLARFEREARLLAQLNHPNIAQIYGLEVSGDAPALVMELVEGPTLAERLQRGAIPLDESLSIALQIAQALEAAHERGIIHRDLKPQNIKASPEGSVKVLDFGLAKAMEGQPPGVLSPAELDRSPTLTIGATGAGVVLGTAAYMAPEQARGLAVDKRADIWAFGVILFEMLSGRAAFAAGTVPDTLAAVLTREVGWEMLPASTPPAIRRLLRHCLERDPNNRLHDIADARLVLAEPVGKLRDDPAIPSVPSFPRRFGALGLGLLALAAALGAMAVRWTIRSPSPAATPVVATLSPPPGTSYYFGNWPGPSALSRDGSRLVFAAVDADSVVRLYVREMASGEQRVLQGTEGAQYPFWSADGRWIGYFSKREASLRKISAAGGAPITVCRADDVKGGTWSREDVILFTPDAASPLFRVSADGGEPVRVTSLDAGRSNSHRHPRFLPDGRHFLFLARSPSAGGSAVMTGSLDGGESRELVATAVQAEYASGELLFEREGTLLAQAFDADALQLTGSPEPVATNVGSIPGASVGLFSVSDSGTLVFHRGVLQQAVQLELRDRAGRLLERLGAPDAGFRDMEFSPAGERVVFARQNGDLFLLDLARGSELRFTLEASEEIWPVWAPDGETLFYGSNLNGPHDIYRKAVTGTGREELVLDVPEAAVPGAVSPDGRTLLYVRYPPSTQGLWSLDLASGRSERAVDRGVFQSRVAFSPDGRWILFVALGEGQSQVFATSFPGPGRILQVSQNGGAIPFWVDAGREILYLDPLGNVVSVPVTATATSLDFGPPRTLFRALPPSLGYINVAASPNGQRFVLAREGAFGAANELVVVTDWTSRLKRR